MPSSDYIHGYSTQEQLRLIQQAYYLKDTIILRELDFLEKGSLLEMGCGVGAVLGILGQTFPQLKLSGIDREAEQIAFAYQYLQQLDLPKIELKIGDASHLPWAEATFDYVYAIWFLEHLSNPVEILKEAYRVLKPGGTIILTETDYRTILISPPHSDYTYLQQSLNELLQQAGGKYYIGSILGLLLLKAGFQEVSNKPFSLHYFSRSEDRQLQGFIDYICGWLEPTIEQMIEKLGKNPQQLQSGLEIFRQLPKQLGSASITIYRAIGRKL